MNTVAAILLPACLLAAACGGGPGSDQTDSTGAAMGPALVSLPGVVTDPSGAAVSPDTGVSVLIYYWIPLDDHQQTEDDLTTLAGAASPQLVVLPVQPDAASRNFAQTLINDLGISLPVCLADQDVISAVGGEILPSALLLRPDGSEHRDTGFGCPVRILGAPAPGE